MLEIAWLGAGPSAAMVKALRAAGIAIARRSSGGERARVIATALGKKAPDRATEGAWLWVSTGPLDPGAVEEAARRGAYASIATGAPAAAAQIVKRLTELSSPEAS